MQPKATTPPCQMCGAPIARKRGRFCSYACHHASMRTVPPPGPCAYCGQPVGQNKMRKPKRYCSIACFSAFRKTVPPTTCETCGAPMSGGKPSRPRRFCSYRCAAESTVPVAERFWAKIDKNGPVIRPELGPCWGWNGAKSRNGYGNLGAGRTGSGTLVATRVSWEIHNGPIPEGQWVLHRCDNPPCARPDHLFLGDNADNQRDRFAKGRRRVKAT